MQIGFNPDSFKTLSELESKNFWFIARNRLIIWALLKYAGDMRSFLEIGCGTGFVLSAVARQFPAVEVTGSEYLEDGLFYARQRLPGVQLLQMDARSIPYVSKLDAIGIFDVLEHISEDEVVLQQVCKSLRPGGMMFISVPQHRWLWSAVDEYACHVRRYRANELHERVSRAGFEIIRSTSFVSTLLPAMYLSRLLKQKKIESVMDATTELRIHPILNSVFGWILNFELVLIRLGIALPFGGTRFLVARKALTTEKDV